MTFSLSLAKPLRGLIIERSSGAKYLLIEDTSEPEKNYAIPLTTIEEIEEQAADGAALRARLGRAE